MTCKLIKYEFRSMLRLMGILWVGLPATAMVMACFNRFFSYDGLGEYPAVLHLLDNLISFLYIALFMALIGATVMVIILRFYRGLLRDEGYLMHTLPVKTWQLITAKGVTAVCVSIISMAVAVVSILLISMFNIGLVYAGDFFRYTGEVIAERPLLVVIVLECILLGISWLMAVIYKIYASMSIGQLAAKHKIALSVAAHIGISIAGVLLLSFLGDVVFDAFSGVLDSVDRWLSGIGPDGSATFSLLVVILVEATQVAVYHAVSEQLLRRKLNLE